MICPECNKNSQVAINLHSDGYAESVLECGNCGVVWIEADERIVQLTLGS